jgi:hypothetical protein
MKYILFIALSITLFSCGDSQEIEDLKKRVEEMEGKAAEEAEVVIIVSDSTGNAQDVPLETNKKASQTVRYHCKHCNDRIIMSIGKNPPSEGCVLHETTWSAGKTSDYHEWSEI